MTSSRINKNSYGIISNPTLNSNDVGLIVYLYIIQSYINPWHIYTHVVQYRNFLNLKHSPRPIFLTYATLYVVLCSSLGNLSS